MENKDFLDPSSPKIIKIVENFKLTYNYDSFENEILKIVYGELAIFIQKILNEVFYDKKFMTMIKEQAGKKSLSYEGHRLKEVNILNGQRILITSPYFYNRRKKRGPQKDGRRAGNNIDSQLGLNHLGFVSNYSGNLASEVCKTVIISPSYEMANKLLEDRGIGIDKKTMERLIRHVGNIGLYYRGQLCWETEEKVNGQTLVISLDGGRMRERKAKRGKKRTGQKQQGYTTEWREPKLMTIYVMDENGDIIKEIPPLYDATLQGPDAIIEIMMKHLNQVDITQVKRIVFSADGAPWIWHRIEELIKTRFKGIETYQVLDYTHANQSLGEIFSLLSKKQKGKEKLLSKAKELLWQGEIDKIKELIEANFTGQGRTKALKKWRNYFDTNRQRMQYKQFKENKLPCGSGYVESAIRRVINLRIKSCGSFWLEENAEIFLFLRCQLISGRWNIFWNNLFKKSIDIADDGVNPVILTNYYKKWVA